MLLPLRERPKYQKSEYAPFGERIAQGTTEQIAQRYTYTGRDGHFHNPGMFYRYRTYAPSYGRFEQRDPIGYYVGMNLYEYVKDRPGYWRDPLGKKCCPTPVDAWEGYETKTDMQRVFGKLSLLPELGDIVQRSSFAKLSGDLIATLVQGEIKAIPVEGLTKKFVQAAAGAAVEALKEKSVGAGVKEFIGDIAEIGTSELLASPKDYLSDEILKDHVAGSVADLTKVSLDKLSEGLKKAIEKAAKEHLLTAEPNLIGLGGNPDFSGLAKRDAGHEASDDECCYSVTFTWIADARDAVQTRNKVTPGQRGYADWWWCIDIKTGQSTHCAPAPDNIRKTK